MYRQENIFMDAEADSDSDTSDDDSDAEGFTVFRMAGQTFNIDPGQGGTVIHAPGLRNIQIGDGRCLVVGSHGHSNQARHPNPTRRPPSHTNEPQHKLSDSTSSPSNADLRHVCNNIGKHWQQLATGLGLSRGQVEGIEVDFHIEGHYEMAWQTLLKWKRQNGDSARICDLVRVLHDIGLTEFAKDIPVN